MRPSLIDHDVVIVGAGVAGLRCAHQLIHTKGVDDVLVVDALERVGGRILANRDFVPGMAIEVGAELLHGANTSLTRLAEEQGWSLREVFTWAQGDGGPSAMASDGGIGYYYLGDKKRLLAYDSKDKDFRQFNESVWALSDIKNVESISPNKSMQDYFDSQNLSGSMLKLADAGYANTAGGHLSDISLRITCRYERQWIELEDEGDYRIQPSFDRVVRFLSKGVSTKLGWKVSAVDYAHLDRIVLTNEIGDEISCRRLVITVPTSVFHCINYSPPIPRTKLDAAASFGMRRAAKVLLRFSRGFWPADTHGVICSDSFIPEFWVNSNAGVGRLVQREELEPQLEVEPEDDVPVKYLVTGFVGAACADRLLSMDREKIFSNFLAQLDEIYGTRARPHPARDSFEEGMYFDWGDVPTIQGGYSYPRVGQDDDAAEELACPIDNRIFFAGEATSFEQPGMSVHSAMDTGTRAAMQVASSLQS